MRSAAATGRGLAQYRPSGGNGPMPRQNENIRYTFEDNLSWTKGRHNYKFGFFAERDSKTEPGSNDYNGVYNFGHNADNPLSTGNGYANALIGVFTTLRGARLPRRRRGPPLAVGLRTRRTAGACRRGSRWTTACA